jgi:hypothetical protein
VAERASRLAGCSNLNPNPIFGCGTGGRAQRASRPAGCSSGIAGQAGSSAAGQRSGRTEVRCRAERSCTVPPQAGIQDFLPPYRPSVPAAPLQPQTHGLPQPRATTAAWLVMPPRAVRMPTAACLPCVERAPRGRVGRLEHEAGRALDSCEVHRAVRSYSSAGGAASRAFFSEMQTHPDVLHAHTTCATAAREGPPYWSHSVLPAAVRYIPGRSARAGSFSPRT